MVADSSVIGGTLELREREHRIKIVPSTDDRALIGFSGDEHHGIRLLELARVAPGCASTVDQLPCKSVS